MKKYKKKPSKLLQIRLSENEYKEIIEFIKRFNVTYREFILAIRNELSEAKVLRGGYFWESDQQYAYSHRHNYDKQLDKDSKCELCGAGRTEYVGSIVRHHHYGYIGDNAFKVQIVCNKCHGKLSGKEWKDKDWDYVKKNFAKIIR